MAEVQEQEIAETNASVDETNDNKHSNSISTSIGNSDCVSSLPRMLRAKPSVSTEAAEYLRLSAWLDTNGLTHLLPMLKDGGVTKLSVLELLTISDLKSVGMKSEYAELITAKISEMTSQTKDVLERLNINASPETPLSRLALLTLMSEE